MVREGAQRRRRAAALAMIAGLAGLAVAWSARAQQPAAETAATAVPAPPPLTSTPAPAGAPVQQSAPTDLDLPARAAKARGVAHQYAQRLGAGLTDALKSRGPVAAIGACNTLAPELNTTLSDESGFDVTRTSARVRNPDNAPDDWETAVLDDFQKAMTAGADPKTLETYDVVVSKEGQRLFRYMRPIIMREPCLACHGSNVSHDVKSEIAKYYVDDKALGFAVGDLRGAFSLIQQLD